jgi:hypothetical protein
VHCLGDEGEEALCAVAQDVVDLVGECEEFLVALAGGGVVGGETFGEGQLKVYPPLTSPCRARS